MGSCFGMLNGRHHRDLEDDDDLLSPNKRNTRHRRTADIGGDDGGDEIVYRGKWMKGRRKRRHNRLADGDGDVGDYMSNSEYESDSSLAYDAVAAMARSMELIQSSIGRRSPAPRNMPKRGASGKKRSTAEMEDFDYSFKVVFIGSEATGKSSLIHRYETSTFPERYSKTISIEFGHRDLITPRTGHRVRVALWDCAAEGAYADVRSAYYVECHAIILVYDVSDLKSFLDLRNTWIAEVMEYLDLRKNHVVVWVVGNKVDCDSARIVEYAQGRELADAIGARFCETSAKTGQNVEWLLDTVGQEMVDHFGMFS